MCSTLIQPVTNRFAHKEIFIFLFRLFPYFMAVEMLFSISFFDRFESNAA